MTSANWARVEAVFDRALDLSGEARAAYLASIGASEPQVLTEVKGLLESASRVGDFLERPVGEAFPDQVGPVLDRLAGAPRFVGRRVGAYRVVEPIGHGGMGRVFRAERADGAFSRQVALKVLRWELADAEAIARFERERQVLATLEHPGIARLLNGGVTDDDLPYLIMELVDGVPIDTYCRDHALELEPRLRLFQKVCAAVQFAHRNLLVHRDLKPSNILVTEEGDVKLLDFGIAKLLEAEGGRDDTELHPMTPGYAAPEQLTGEPISTATDVYALGLILHKLLTGRRPYGRDSVSSPHMALQAMEIEPRPPSTQVAAEGAASAAGISARTWAKALKGDLDSIVLKALRRHPIDRYLSADALSDDIDRYLARRPVRARRRRRTYVFRRFVTRNRIPVVAALGVAVALVIGVIGTLTQAKRAVEEADRAQRVSEVVLSLFEIADPWGAAPRGEYRAEDLLDRGTEAASVQLAGDPETLATLLVWIGRGYSSLGARSKAGETLLLAEELSRASRTSEILAECLLALGELANDELRYESAAEHLAEAATIRVEMGDTLSAEFGRINFQLARAFSGHRPDAALAYVTKAQDLIEAEYGPDAPILLSVEVTRAQIQRERGDLATSEAIYEDLIRRWRAGKAEGTSVLSGPLNSLAIVRRLRGDLDGAIEAYEEALEIMNQYNGPVHPTTLMVRANLAGALDKAGDVARAEALLRENIDLVRTSHPERVDDLGRRLITLGGAYLLWERPGAAVQTFREAADLFRDAGPAFGASEALSRIKLSTALTFVDDSAAADVEWSLAVGYLTRPGGQGLNAAGRAQLNWLLARYDQYGRSADASRLRALLEELTPTEAASEDL